MITNFIKIDFGIIGLKIGDVIFFKPSNKEFKVGSGNGTPGNGGCLLQWEDQEFQGLMSIRLATKKLINRDSINDTELLRFWTFNGKTLRNLYDFSKNRT